jgi:ubiquinol-cytochrome c reductase cytochrome c1 subunit
MPLLTRVPLTGSRVGNCVRTRLCRTRLSERINPSLSRKLTADATQDASSGASQTRVGNALLGTLVAGAAASTVFFTYLRIKDSGFGLAANTIMDDGLHPAAYPWPNNHPLATFDHNRYIPYSICRCTRIN